MYTYVFKYMIYISLCDLGKLYSNNKNRNNKNNVNKAKTENKNDENKKKEELK